MCACTVRFVPLPTYTLYGNSADYTFVAKSMLCEKWSNKLNLYLICLDRFGQKHSDLQDYAIVNVGACARERTLCRLTRNEYVAITKLSEEAT